MIRERVIIPLLNTLILAVCVACAGVAFLYLFRGFTPWRLFWAVLAFVSLLAWLAVMQGMTTIVVKKPAKVYTAETTRVEIVANDPAGAFSAGRWADLPISRDSMISVARRLDAGVSFSHAGLAGPGRPLSRSQYEVLRDLLILRGLAFWINPASHSQGVELSRAGEAVMRHFANGHPDHLPQLTEIEHRCSKLPKLTHAHRDTRGGDY